MSWSDFLKFLIGIAVFVGYRLLFATDFSGDDVAMIVVFISAIAPLLFDMKKVKVEREELKDFKAKLDKLSKEIDGMNNDSISQQIDILEGSTLFPKQ